MNKSPKCYNCNYWSDGIVNDVEVHRPRCTRSLKKKLNTNNKRSYKLGNCYGFFPRCSLIMCVILITLLICTFWYMCASLNMYPFIGFVILLVVYIVIRKLKYDCRSSNV